MTSHELARKLLAGRDAPVHFGFPYGDFWRTQAAPEVTEVTEGKVRNNASIGMPAVVEEDDEGREVILIG